MSINSTIGAGMAEVAANAILVDSIARQSSALASTRQSLGEMTAYAQKLEGNVKHLLGIVNRHSELIDKLNGRLNEVSDERDELNKKNEVLETRILRLKSNDVAQYEKYERQVEYTRDLKDRLQKTEKALKHSSSRSVCLENLQNYLHQVTSALENHSSITEEAKEIMERAQDQFMDSGQLTPDPEMQKVLDELKIKAPDFKLGVAN
jgi:chromosome segregation ATPase